MVLGILVAVAAGIAICHTHHKHQRINNFKKGLVGPDGAPLTKQEWKQLCREHKQALKAEKHARKVDKHLRRAERRGCWRTSLPALPAPAPTQDVQYPNGDVYTTYIGEEKKGLVHGPGVREIPVQGPDAPPAYIAAPTEKM